MGNLDRGYQRVIEKTNAITCFMCGYEIPIYPDHNSSGTLCMRCRAMNYNWGVTVPNGFDVFFNAYDFDLKIRNRKVN
jgi:hypothetical protein